jgi:hypothetical protein
MHYQAVLLSDCYILLYVFAKVNWWDHLDLNQESTNYEFAALTNYAIVPRSIIQPNVCLEAQTLFRMKSEN